MDAIKMLKTRQSERKFLPYSIELEIIEDIIDCGRLAPSAKNMQQLHFVVVDDREILDKLAVVCPYGKFFADCPIAVAVFSKESDWMVEDASAATENILLASKAYGLGSCWVGSYKRPHAKDVEQMLGCPKDNALVTLIAIGKVAQPTTRPPKKSLAEVMSYNKFE